MKLHVVAICYLLFVLLLPIKICIGEKWQGVDESVVQKIAREHGREAKKPLIDTSEGDLQLFVFLSAGTLGGFVAGYYWRVLLEGRKKNSSRAD
ncbi:MAG TPA: hypothetical protein VGJ93_05190 [Desulfuromonadaceae bacterium]|jgi:ABC-type cobalt transport system substrate-binding protein